MNMIEMGQNARRASRALARAATAQKEASLECLAERLSEASADILEANERDLAEARSNGLSVALLDRLTLSEARLEAIASDLRAVTALPDPVGEAFDEAILPNGLRA